MYKVGSAEANRFGFLLNFYPKYVGLIVIWMANLIFSLNGYKGIDSTKIKGLYHKE